MDKRTARRTYHQEFSEAVQRYRSSAAVRDQHTALSPLCTVDDDSDFGGRIRVCVRKRPIHREEIKALEFDVITCAHGGKLVAVHDARMHSDMRHMLMHHHEFDFDRVFSEGEGNEAVYADVAAPLVAETAKGGYATCLMYGQTGSGKTYTMSSIYERAAVDLFEKLSSLSSSSSSGDGGGDGDGSGSSVQHAVSVSFFELAGEVCSDLLNGFERAQLMTGADGSVHAFPLVEVKVSCAAELMAMVRHGFSVRSTSATGVHNASSRSHAVLRVYTYPMVNGGGGENDEHGAGSAGGGGAWDAGFGSEGVLTLVDLAGSEHRIDSMHHTAQRRKEGAEINASLMALKAVVHARAASSSNNTSDMDHLYRLSKLTMALKNSFKLPGAKTTVVATVSPASKDTEHSLNTLRHACVMDGYRTQQTQQQQQGEGGGGAGGGGGGSGGGGVNVDGGRVRTVAVGEVNVAQVSRLARAGNGPSDELTASNGNSFGGGPDPWDDLAGRKLQLAKVLA